MKNTNKLSTRDFAEYFACACVVQGAIKIPVNESFHGRFEKAYSDLVPRLPEEFRPDFKITLNVEGKMSSTLKVIINKMMINNGDLAHFEPSSQDVIIFRIHQKHFAAEKLKKLPLSVNSFFERIAYFCTHSLAT